MDANYTITLVVDADEVVMLKEALLAYTKSAKVNLDNFDMARMLYGKVGEAWNKRKGS